MHLIVCADDFGLNQFIDHGIMALATDGLVTAASCLVDGPTLSLNTRDLATQNVDIGLHLNFTEDLPGAGFVRPLWRLIGMTYSRQINRLELVREIRRQLDRFEELFGFAPHYVDGHQHVHQFPVIRDALLDELTQRYPVHGPWVRSTVRPAGAELPFAFKAAIIESLGAKALAASARTRGFAMNTDLLGVYDFRAGAAEYREVLACWLGMVSAGSLLMCHPAKGGAAFNDALGRQREIEYEALNSPGFRAGLEKRELLLQRMSLLLGNEVRQGMQRID